MMILLRFFRSSPPSTIFEISYPSTSFPKRNPADLVCFIIFLTVLFLELIFVGDGTSEEIRQIIISSQAFKQAEPVPEAYTCSGRDVSPPLSWTGIPPDARGLVLLVRDSDAPSGVFTHWIAFNLPGNLTGLPEGASRANGLLKNNQGRNDFGRTGYNGPCPPPGRVHHYHFQLFALDQSLRFDDPPGAAEVLSAIRGHITAQGEIVGVYRR